MNLDLFAAASVAVLSSFTHCYAMCGGFNIAFWQLNRGSKCLLSLTLLYHFSRIAAYIALGVIFTAFGNVLGFINRGFLLFLLGVFMVLLGFALIFRGKMLEILENQTLFKLFARRILGRFSVRGVRGALILGFCNGFVPCGLVYFFIALSMSGGNFGNLENAGNLDEFNKNLSAENSMNLNAVNLGNSENLENLNAENLENAGNLENLSTENLGNAGNLENLNAVNLANLEAGFFENLFGNFGDFLAKFTEKFADFFNFGIFSNLAEFFDFSIFANLARAALIMLIFGLCTLPALLFFNTLTQILSTKFRLIWSKISYLIIIFYGLYLAFVGFMASA